MKTLSQAAVALMLGMSDPGVLNHRQDPAMPSFSGPACLSEFCVAPTGTPINAVSKVLGKGTAYEDARCYADEIGGAFLYVANSHVGGPSEPKPVTVLMLSTVATCDEQSPSSLPLRDMRTRRGIGLGSKQSDVEAAYGKPDESRSGAEYVNASTRDARRRINVGERSVIYADRDENSLLYARFYYTNGRVTGIELSNSE